MEILGHTIKISPKVGYFFEFGFGVAELQADAGCVTVSDRHTIAMGRKFY